MNSVCLWFRRYYRLEVRLDQKIQNIYPVPSGWRSEYKWVSTIKQGWSCSPSGFGGGNTLSACHDVNSGGWLHFHCGAETAKWGEDLSHIPHHPAWNLLQVSAPSHATPQPSIFSKCLILSKMDCLFSYF